MTTAFVNKDGVKVVVVVNASDDSVNFQLWQDGKAAKTSSPAHSIMTFVL